jgi:Holliday junction resolvasome RuvABC ATP-dependent DNA helicase subunit
MQAVKYADALSIHPTFSLVRDEQRKYDVAAKQSQGARTNALRIENAKLAQDRDARERAKEVEREKTHGPRVRFEMVDGLRAHDVDRAIFRGRRAGDIGHRTVAFYLADCADRRLYQDLGHSNVLSYAEDRHDLSRRSTRNLIAAGRALRDLAKIDQAFAAAKLSWSKVRAIARVAEPPTEDRWLAFALTHSAREVEKEAELCRKGDVPREDRKGLPEIRFDVRMRVSALLHEQYLLARQKLGADLGRDATDEELAGALLDCFLRQPSEGMQSSDSLYRVVVEVHPAGGIAQIRSEDGPIALDAAAAEAACCDGGVVGEEEPHHGVHAPPIPEGLRKRILARDGWRCRVCRFRYQLQVHHIVWRSRRGSNAWSNLMTLCKDCHALVHGGYLSIAGRAPDRLEFRNREGELLAEPSRVLGRGDEPTLEIVPAPSGAPLHGPPIECPRGHSDSAFAAEKPRVAASLPEGEAGPDWLPRHKHLIVPETSRTALRLEPGRALETAPVASADGGPVDAAPGDPLRPASLDDVVGQTSAVDRLRTYARAARQTGRRAVPVLLLGQSGLGKTTLAKAYARELDARLKVIDCATLKDPFTVMGHLADLRDGDAVLLDEIHALPRGIAECLYPAIEDGVAHLPFVDGIAIRMIPCTLPRVAWLAATTNPERMPAAFRNRFSDVELAPYGRKHLVEIVGRAAKRDGFGVDPEAAAVLARAAAGRARAAIRLYVETRTRVEPSGRKSATEADARATLHALELDEDGLGSVHQRILETLRGYGKPMASPKLAVQVGITLHALRTVYEAPLIASRALVPTRYGMALGPGSGG